MESRLFELIYVSAATRLLLPQELTDLLVRARQRNALAGVSGMLLYNAGSFLQILEGPERAVMETYWRIEGDRRHSRVLRLFAGQIDTRSFGEWTMGFVDEDNPKVKALPGFNDFLRSGWARSPDLELSGKVQDIADQFRRGRWRQGVEGSNPAAAPHPAGVGSSKARPRTA